MTPQEALITLYKATQQLQLKAEDHETLRQCAVLVEQTINPKKEETPAPVVPTRETPIGKKK